ncbi:acVLRF1 family peptidyl-tRNA hydrolase [uncultured Jatrophihabitans sp.]|uniref:acVLRF1 family peptidyl-tRNA hydrolase n=1 Tax=uncultured Jatrophihabitans sp. TaxID=1610747 RepID=UPI0035C951AB
MAASEGSVDPPAHARQVSVGPERLSKWLAGFGERHGDADTRLDRDVVALTGSDGDRAWIHVPFPPLVTEGGDVLDALVEHANRPRRVGVLIVRRGGYAAGVFEGAELRESKVGSRYVQGGTKAGGWSQQRYARRRANQADAVFADAADVAARVLGAHTDLDALVAGGDRDAVQTVLADRRLVALPAPSGPWLEVKDPKLAVLRATPAQFRAVRISLVP